MRTTLLIPLLATGVAATARAEIVTIGGSGTTSGIIYRIDDPFSQGLATPARLADMFPPGQPFAISITYDSTRITLDASPGLPDQAYFFGPPTAMTLTVGGHTVTRVPDLDPASAVYEGYLSTLNDFGPLAFDQLSTGFQPVLIDGERFVAADGGPFADGYRVDSAGFHMIDEDGTALASTAIPTQVCMAAFETLGFGIWFTPMDGRPERYMVVGSGEPDRTVDSDGDGIIDGEELALRATLPGLDACDADSDDDSLPDGAEIAGGTNPTSGDTDNDGLPDATDPEPTDPASSIDEIAEDVRDAAAGVLDIPEGEFDAPNANAQRGRRNALANRLQAAAGQIEDGNLEEALAILRHVRELLDGDGSPPDVMDDGPAKDALRAEVDALIALVESQL